jgi:hypothetical protein
MHSVAGLETHIRTVHIYLLSDGFKRYHIFLPQDSIVLSIGRYVCSYSSRARNLFFALCKSLRAAIGWLRAGLMVATMHGDEAQCVSGSDLALYYRYGLVSGFSVCTHHCAYAPGLASGQRQVTPHANPPKSLSSHPANARTSPSTIHNPQSNHTTSPHHLLVIACSVARWLDGMLSVPSHK